MKYVHPDTGSENLSMEAKLGTIDDLNNENVVKTAQLKLIGT